MTRRERLEAKVERRRDWAGKAAARGDARIAGAERLADQIPLGQPILVNHHSERRARRDAERIRSGFEKGFGERALAEHHEAKADGLEAQLDRSVFSDDADAVAQLVARVAAREAACARIKVLNAALRREVKAGLPEGWLYRVGATEAERRAIENNARYNWDHAPTFAPYVTTNLRGRIAADKKRLADVKARQARAAAAEAAPGGVVVQGTGDWVRVTFAEKPAREVLDALKAAGFRWGGGSWVGPRAGLPAGLEGSS